MSADAHHPSAPPDDGDGVARVMRPRWRMRRWHRTTIDYLNAHATSTPLGDRAEAIAIKRVFGDHARKLAVSSTKSMTGHLLGGAGALEAGLRVLAIRDQVAPPTINLDRPDEGIRAQPRAERVRPRDHRLRHDELLRLRRHQRLPDSRGARRPDRRRRAEPDRDPPQEPAADQVGAARPGSSRRVARRRAIAGLRRRTVGRVAADAVADDRCLRPRFRRRRASCARTCCGPPGTSSRRPTSAGCRRSRRRAYWQSAGPTSGRWSSTRRRSGGRSGRSNGRSPAGSR